MYYPCSENKGPDQLRSYCEADLHLCFRIRQKSSFLTMRLIYRNSAFQAFGHLSVQSVSSTRWILRLLCLGSDVKGAYQLTWYLQLIAPLLSSYAKGMVSREGMSLFDVTITDH